ncbi:hypothetical protein ACWT_5843 [Actinoplanes sp. SE50]|uniref:RIP homotypic interaction motif-containing protein n=1 Tax=unclassified Actinoplanes TaxID=2626549 RepID=UPI00023EBDBF|nr:MULTISPECIES: RIP homotypic interaction motif-containing protein [unclassified Actinoplanes]AEV86861.1 hypothetical protein ACPL_5974 [Actinoplanes sp. SE50/110]ATO85258.1 hypothetical protein ACWT_5843 [Actinoplanes sp. SE50]SLM02668.1 hypothetical protein ACSP50_5950 [Actinoplanes sp. SE50/110]
MDLDELSAAVMPYVSAAVAAYGGAMAQRATDAAVDSGSTATVAWGRQLLARLVASRRGRQVTEAVEELARDPADDASRVLLQAQVLKAVSIDAHLAAELEHIVQEARADGDHYTVSVHHSSGFQIGSNNQQNVFMRPSTE